MAKGKYAARATNRREAEQADRIRQLEAELTAAKTETASARAQLERERRTRSSLVTERADKLSAAQIAEVRRECEATMSRRQATVASWARELNASFTHDELAPSWWFTELYPLYCWTKPNHPPLH